MDTNFILLMGDVLESIGLNFQIISDKFEEIENFDLGFRNRWYENCQYDKIILYLKSMKKNKIYMMKDQFDVHYFCFLLQDGDVTKIGVVGPYVQDNIDEVLINLEQKDKLSIMQSEELKKYYRMLPVIEDDSNIRDNLVKSIEYLTGRRGELEIAIKNDESDSVDELVVRDVLEYQSTVEEAVERYEKEVIFIDAIEQGDYDKAILAKTYFTRYESVIKRYHVSLRTQKNALYTYNTICRRAVENAGVHPGHVDQISREFAQKIEVARNIKELKELMDTMIHKYCLVVRNYSLQGYSDIICKAINYIDFHLTETLSLSLVADKLSIDANYLSTQFTREVGKNLTSYINEKRIQKSLKYLGTTEVSISEIAERVGIHDYNYFSRLFKKITNMTPTEYRKVILHSKW